MLGTRIQEEERFVPDLSCYNFPRILSTTSVFTLSAAVNPRRYPFQRPGGPAYRPKITKLITREKITDDASRTARSALSSKKHRPDSRQAHTNKASRTIVWTGLIVIDYNAPDWYAVFDRSVPEP